MPDISGDSMSRFTTPVLGVAVGQSSRFVVLLVAGVSALRWWFDDLSILRSLGWHVEPSAAYSTLLRRSSRKHKVPERFERCINWLIRQGRPCGRG